MNNNSLKKVLPVFDLGIILVIILFCTAGLMQVRDPEPPDIPSQETEEQFAKLLKENEHLESELEAKKTEANDLENKLLATKEGNPNPQPLETLEAALASAKEKEQSLNEAGSSIKGMNDKFDYVGKAFQKRYEWQKVLELLKSGVKSLDDKIKELEREKQELEKEINEDDLRRAKVQKLKDQIEKLEKQIKHLQQQIKEMKEKIEKIKSDDAPWWGPHRGPYILLECDGKGVVVYLDSGSNRRIAINASEADIDWLRDKIRQISGAVLTVRPSGFEESYSKFFEILTTFALEEEEKNSNEIDLSFWPIRDDEPISKYMSKGD